MNKITVDIAIIGGGIAGLWTFNQLQKQDYKVALLENHSLGNEQTIASQGIIHGGLKYALQGMLTPDANAIKQMPTLWQNCLNGNGILDLRTVKVLSDCQYLWSTGNIATNISSFFASKALHGQVETPTPTQYPEALKHPSFHGKAYKLNETILNIPSLLQSLATPFQNNIIKIDEQNGCNPCYTGQGKISHLELRIQNEPYILTAQKYIFTAGQGNETLIKNMPNAPKMQKRPLQMVFVKAPKLPSFYAHCIGMSSTPRITITTHPAKDGQTVWYMGGKLAEDGVHRDKTEQLKIAKQEIAELFPWLKIDGTWDSFFINRAEAWQKLGLKPETETVTAEQNFIIGWPTKLVLCPMLTKKIISILEDTAVIKSNVGTDLSLFPKPRIAEFPWDN
jgi:glycerol-3-phosphate dehydrogenase